MRNTMSNLQEAYEAIESGDLVTAQAIAAELLKTNQQDAEAWFILSEATAGDRKLIFLQKAIKLNPNLSIARERLAELERPAVPEPVLPPADFDRFGEPEPITEPEIKVTKNWQEALKEEPVVTPKISSLREPEVEAAWEKEVEPTAVASPPPSKRPKAPAQPSQLFNTLGIGVSLLLAIIMILLLFQALAAYF
ncbi:MAG: hypothetical protein OT477_23970 [Chloroflexi bacterium]|nr:hypothetical protein [Chloroflexota bacterium]